MILVPAPTAAPEIVASPWRTIDEFLEFWLRSNPLGEPERKVFEGYYASYLENFGPYVRSHFARQTREMDHLIRRRPSARLLEVGAGCGTESLWFGLQGASVTGLDVTNERLQVARARHEWLSRDLGRPLDVVFRECSLFDFSPEQAFDLIWMEMTFHHLEPRERVYEKLFELLHPGGSLAICEANGWNPLLQLQFFLRRGFKTKTHVVDSSGKRVEYGNERITTPLAISRGLEKAGFRVDSVRRFRILPNLDPPISWLDVEESILRWLPVLSTHYTVVATRPEGH